MVYFDMIYDCSITVILNLNIKSKECYNGIWKEIREMCLYIIQELRYLYSQCLDLQFSSYLTRLN